MEVLPSERMMAEHLAATMRSRGEGWEPDGDGLIWYGFPPKHVEVILLALDELSRVNAKVAAK